MTEQELKPPLLSDEAIIKLLVAWTKVALLSEPPHKPDVADLAKQVAQAQREADIRHYEGYMPGLCFSDDIKNCLDCAREAVVDAICCEDGLDGGTGEKVIKWITDILGDYNEWIKTHSDK